MLEKVEPRFSEHKKEDEESESVLQKDLSNWELAEGQNLNLPAFAWSEGRLVTRHQFIWCILSSAVWQALLRLGDIRGSSLGGLTLRNLERLQEKADREPITLYGLIL